MKTNKQKMTCSIVGARGYAGLETARLLLQHPNAELVHAYATTAFDLSKLLGSPRAKSVQSLTDSDLQDKLKQSNPKEKIADVVFLATPAEVSMELAPKLIAHGSKVIDLSGAFRLQKNDYQKWYGFEHSQKEMLAQAEYGLAPWCGPARDVNLIANPGCFATAISLALIPLVKEGLIDESSIVVDAKSGTSGGGKKATEALLFTEVDGECLPYKVGRHQHYPEIVEAIELFAGKTIDAHFTTSLLPVRRGIIAGIYGSLKSGVGEAQVKEAFAKAYSDYELVQFASVQEEPGLLSLKKVVGTGKTQISYVIEGKKIYLFSCIDNLLKGAASQAVENFNRLSDLSLETGLGQLEAVV